MDTVDTLSPVAVKDKVTAAPSIEDLKTRADRGGFPVQPDPVATVYMYKFKCNPPAADS